MNPIDSLIDAACGIRVEPLRESVAVTEGVIASAQALYDSFLAVLGDVGQYDFFRAEFRLASGPHVPGQEPEAIPQQPVSVDVNVNAIVRQIQDVIGDILARSVNIPAVYKSYAVAGEPGSPGTLQELTKISVPDASFSREYSRELARGHLPREMTKETIKDGETHAIVPQPLNNRPLPDNAWYRSRDDKSGKRPAPTAVRQKEGGPEPSPLSQNVEQTIKRSTLVIDQLEHVARNVVSTEGIVKEVSRSSFAIGQLRNIRLEPMASMPAEVADMSAAYTGSPQPRPRVLWQKPAAERPASGIQNVKAESEANARGLSDAISRSVTAHASGIPPMKEIPVPPMTHVARAMTAIVGSYQLAGNYIGLGSTRAPIARLVMAGSGSSSPASAPMNLYRSMEAVSQVSTGITQSPIFNLVNNVATPGVSAAAVDMPVRMSGARASVVPRQANPVINLAMGMAAAQAAQKAGTSAIREFVRASPSMNDSYNAADWNGMNGSTPGIMVERETSNNVNRTSNFHNTFNISITMKGGSEESDMKELGKKIGRILSDEIKRYGGA